MTAPKNETPEEKIARHIAAGRVPVTHYVYPDDIERAEKLIDRLTKGTDRERAEEESNPGRRRMAFVI